MQPVSSSSSSSSSQDSVMHTTSETKSETKASLSNGNLRRLFSGLLLGSSKLSDPQQSLPHAAYFSISASFEDEKMYFAQVKSRFQSAISIDIAREFINQYLQSKSGASSLYKNCCTAVAFFTFEVKERYFGCSYPFGALIEACRFPLVQPFSSLLLSPDHVVRSVNLDGSFIPSLIKVGKINIHSKQDASKVPIDQMPNFYCRFLREVLSLIPDEKKCDWLGGSDSIEGLFNKYFHLPDVIPTTLTKHPILRVLPFFAINSASSAKQLLSDILRPLQEYNVSPISISKRNDADLGQLFWFSWDSEKKALCCQRTSADKIYLKTSQIQENNNPEKHVATVMNTFTLFLSLEHLEFYDANLSIDSCNFSSETGLNDILHFISAFSSCEEKIRQEGVQV